MSLSAKTPCSISRSLAAVGAEVAGRAGGTDSVDKLPDVFGGVNVLIVAALVLVPLVHFYLFRMKHGLHTMAAGEHPQAAESVGIDVSRNRYAAVVASGAPGSRG